MKKSELPAAIVTVALIAVMFWFVWLLTGWVGVGFLALWVGGSLVVYLIWEKRKTAKNMTGMAGMAGELRRLSAGNHGSTTKIRAAKHSKSSLGDKARVARLALIAFDALLELA